MDLTIKHAKRLVVLVIGTTVVLFGVALLVLPGPGLLVIAFGLSILATEFIWARRLLRRVKDEGTKLAEQALGRDSESKNDADTP